MTRFPRVMVLLGAGLTLTLGGLAYGQGGHAPMMNRSGMSYLPGFWELGTTEVQKELELVPEQVEKLEKLGKEYMEEMRTAYQGREDWQKMSQEERTAKYKEVYENRRKRSEEVHKEVENILLPHQLKILQDRRFRQTGSSMLNSARVIEAVKLTDEQKEKIKKIRADMMEQYRKLQEKSSADILSVLTEEQKAELAKQVQGMRRY